MVVVGVKELVIGTRYPESWPELWVQNQNLKKLTDHILEILLIEVKLQEITA